MALQLGTHQSTIIQLALMEFAGRRRSAYARGICKEGDTADELRLLLRQLSEEGQPMLMARTNY